MLNEISSVHKSDARGQVVLEYFILFTVVALLTVIGLTRVDDDVRDSLQGFFDSATHRIAQPQP